MESYEIVRQSHHFFSDQTILEESSLFVCAASFFLYDDYHYFTGLVYSSPLSSPPVVVNSLRETRQTQD